jgi:hypothetical protein
VHQCVLSNVSGIGSLFLNAAAGTDLFSGDSCSKNVGPRCQHEVPMLTLDDFSAKHIQDEDTGGLPKVDMLSIDTEGFDLLLLHGGRKLLERTRYLDYDSC